MSVAIAADRIVRIGEPIDVLALRGPATEVIDLRGGLLLPGFRDAHLHPMMGAIDLVECRLSGPPGPVGYQSQVRAYAVAHPGRPFIRGSGWLYAAFPKEGPSRNLLDAVVPDRPVFLKAIDGHSGWEHGRVEAGRHHARYAGARRRLDPARSGNGRADRLPPRVAGDGHGDQSAPEARPG